MDAGFDMARKLLYDSGCRSLIQSQGGDEMSEPMPGVSKAFQTFLDEAPGRVTAPTAQWGDSLHPVVETRCDISL